MNKEIIELFSKYYHNFCSQEELDKIAKILRSGEFMAEWESMLEAESNLLNQKNIGIAKTLSQENKVLWHRILRTLGVRRNDRFTFRQIKFLRLASAAALVFGILISIYFYYDKLMSSPDTVEFINEIDIAPGKSGATLTLANGQKINLSEADNGGLGKESGTEITKTNEGQIEYTNNNSTNLINGANTLATTRGQSFMVRLSDGSKVWLNADSKITYRPILVENGERCVVLEGEAYFEVAKDKDHPFIVVTNKQKVQALGTQFNIMSYSDESTSITTLVEGSVSVSTQISNTIATKANNKVILKPGQQSMLSSQNKLTVSKANIEPAIAWKNSDFVFDGESIEDVMKKIARWYDVEVVYDGEKPSEKIIGSVSNTNNLSKVLELLSATSGVQFSVKNRKIHVSKN